MATVQGHLVPRDVALRDGPLPPSSVNRPEPPARARESVPVDLRLRQRNGVGLHGELVHAEARPVAGADLGRDDGAILAGAGGAAEALEADAGALGARVGGREEEGERKKKEKRGEERRREEKREKEEKHEKKIIEERRQKREKATETAEHRD